MGEPPGRPAHALSIDVEDWFQVLNLQQTIPRAQWEQQELRCAESMQRILALLAEHGARATFFFLGWIAERLPDVIRAVAAAGHEIGSHGYDHKLLTELGPDGFDADLARTEEVLQRLGGVTPVLFRACTWSITRRTPWAPEILARRGYRIDSSIFPVRHPDYGVPGAPDRPYRLQTAAGELLEFPPTTLRLLGRSWPVGGGGYLRLLPLGLLARALRQAERDGAPGCVYVHPWEFDPEQPRVGLRGLRRFRHYVNLHRTLPKLRRLLQKFRFTGLQEALQGNASWLAKCRAFNASELLG